MADNYFTGSKDNLKKWIGHPRFELIRHGNSLPHHLSLWDLLYLNNRVSYPPQKTHNMSASTTSKVGSCKLEFICILNLDKLLEALVH